MTLVLQPELPTPAPLEDIASFAGEDAAAWQVYAGIAQVYARLARDQQGTQQEIAALRAFLERA